jgi:hypothetical protein
VNNEVKGTWILAILVYFEILYQHSSEGTKGNEEKY